MITGYIITDTAQEALDAFSQEGVRFAATLSDGHGFVAFDEVIPKAEGRLLLAQEPIPEYPDTWPNREGHVIPKRRIATGMEHFALISEVLLDYAMETEAVKGIAYVGNGLLLIESDGPVVGGDVWSASVVSYRDKRVLASV